MKEAFKQSNLFFAAYLMRYHQMSLQQAFCRTKEARPIINPNLSFLQQLAEFEKKLHGEEACSPWRDHTVNGITKRLPVFIIEHFLDDYQIEFEVNHAKRASLN